MYKVGHAVTKEGRQGITRLADDSLSLDMQEHTPEELFAMAYAACYHSAMNAVKEPRSIDNNHRVEVIAGVDEDKKGKPLYIKILVGFEGLDKETSQRLAGYADQVCRYSTAVEGQIEKEIEIIDY